MEGKLVHRLKNLSDKWLERYFIQCVLKSEIFIPEEDVQPSHTFDRHRYQPIFRIFHLRRTVLICTCCSGRSNGLPSLCSVRDRIRKQVIARFCIETERKCPSAPQVLCFLIQMVPMHSSVTKDLAESPDDSLNTFLSDKLKAQSPDAFFAALASALESIFHIPLLYRAYIFLPIPVFA